jgi:CHAT domain-containing protein
MHQADDERHDVLIEQLAQVATGQGRLRFLRRHQELWDPSVVDRLYTDVVRLARTDLQQADRLARAATWVARKLEDDGSRGQSLRAMGHVAFSLGKYREALKHYDGAIAVFRRMGREVDVARTLNGALQTLISLGRYDDAFKAVAEARAIYERSGNRLGLARLDTNMGNILYRQDRFEEALALYAGAHAQFADIGDSQDIAAALVNKAMVYISLNAFEESIEAYRKAREYCDTHDMPLLVLRVDYNVAYLHYLRGEYARAMALYRGAQEEADALGDTYHSALCDLDRSEMYLELNLSQDAADLGERARARFEQMGMDYEAAKAITTVAIAAGHYGEISRSQRLFERARRLFALEQNHAWLALVDYYEAAVLYRNAQYPRARRLCRSALDRFADASAAGRAGLCELLLARLDLQADHLDAAERACSGAIERWSAAPTPNLMYQAHFVLGLIHEQRGDREAAYDCFRKSHEDLEQLRSHLQAEDLKVAFLKDKLSVYESLVVTCLALGSDSNHRDAAFGYVEEAKSRSLADLIAFRAATLEPRVHNAATDDVRRLRHDLNWHYRQLELEQVGRPKPSQERAVGLRRETAALEKQLARALDDVRRTDQEFAALQSGVAQSAREVRSALSADTILLEYYQARGRYYVCIVGHDRLEIVPVADAAHVRTLLMLLQFQLSKFNLEPDFVTRFGRQLREATESHLRDLYTALIAPIRDRLDAEHLVVIPHDLLHALPFHALFDGDRALIDDFTISYAPSASVYGLCCAKTAAGTGPALIMGVPDALAPCIQDEVGAIAQILPDSHVFLGADATADRLRTHGPGSRFVHVATHGLFRRDHPMFSSIRLGDGPLSVYDLYELQLSAELVTLSGCSTGLTVAVGGDELLGLVRGLLYAGARAVLLTLWDAYDRSTADFMEAFYRHLSSGSSKARAAQYATWEIRAKYPHPFYWAPFTLVGKVLDE